MDSIRRFKCIVAYDGSNYAGWQRQKNAPSIQQIIEEVIYKISHIETYIVASGRTDAQVHAKGQVFHFDTSFYLDANMWKKALNGHLPKDIFILECEEVNTEFHARFSAKAKQYDYLINLGKYDVFTRKQMFQCSYKLNIDKMKECSKLFIGKHDFTAYCGNSLETHPNQVREIYSISFELMENNILKISFYGKGFLRYMVRMLVGTMIEVGRERIKIEDAKEILDSKIKGKCRYNAKPWGLYLIRVEY